MQPAINRSAIRCRESATITLSSVGVTLSEDHVHYRIGQWIADAKDTVIVRVAKPKAFAISPGRESENTRPQRDSDFGTKDREGIFICPDRMYRNRVFGQREFVNIQVSLTLYT